MGDQASGGSEHEQGESTLDHHQPVWQPLEVVSGDGNPSHGQEPLEQQPMGVNVKVSQQTVVSHGGPRTGPESFMEMRTGGQTMQIGGEHQTGMV